MGFISEVVPQVSAAAVPTQSSSVTKSGSAANINTSVSQPAAIVSLSADSKSRSVSSGSNKFVDSTFGSESNKAEKEKEDSKKPSQDKIHVLA